MTEAAEQLPYHLLESSLDRQVPKLVGVELDQQEIPSTETIPNSDDGINEIETDLETGIPVSTEFARRSITRLRSSKAISSLDLLNQYPPRRGSGRSRRRRGSCGSCIVSPIETDIKIHTSGCQNCGSHGSGSHKLKS